MGVGAGRATGGWVVACYVGSNHLRRLGVLSGPLYWWTARPTATFPDTNYVDLYTLCNRTIVSMQVQ